MPKGIYQHKPTQGFQKGHPNWAFKKGEGWWKGKKLSEGHRKNISEGHKGLISSSKGKKRSEEFREKCKKRDLSYLWKPKIIEKSRLKRSGENHYLWKGGIENHQIKNERNDPAYQKWVKLVKKRDKNTCRINNKDCSGYHIVHHILSWSEYPELRYNINNGITLCQHHHPRKRVEEQRLIPFFQETVTSREII